MNDYDLQYFAAARRIREEESGISEIVIDDADLEFYKQRILDNIEALFEKAAPTNKHFNAYLKSIIDEFKFTDKNELIQQEYGGDGEDGDCGEDEELFGDPPTHHFLKKIQKSSNTLDSFVVRLVKKDDEDPTFIPTIKDYEIKTPYFKAKKN